MLKKLTLILFILPFTLTPFKDKEFQKALNQQETIIFSLLQEDAQETPEEMLSLASKLFKVIKKICRTAIKHLRLHHTNNLNYCDKNLFNEKLERLVAKCDRIEANAAENYLYNSEKYHNNRNKNFDKNFKDQASKLLKLLENQYQTQLTIIKEKNLSPHEIFEYFEYDEIMEFLEYLESFLDKTIQQIHKDSIRFFVQDKTKENICLKN